VLKDFNSIYAQIGELSERVNFNQDVWGDISLLKKFLFEKRCTPIFKYNYVNYYAQAFIILI
jgi:hypothetical protein